MFADFFAASKTIRHEIRNIVVEEAAGKVATEQGYIGELQDGSLNDMHNCNFFDFDADGKFKRVIIWMAAYQPAPLIGASLVSDFGRTRAVRESATDAVSD